MDYETDGEIHSNDTIENTYQKQINSLLQTYNIRCKRIKAKFLLIGNGTVFNLSTNNFLAINYKNKRNLLKISGKEYYVDILIATHFVSNPDPETKTVVFHKNGNTIDNSWDNLIWCSPQEFRDFRAELFLETYLQDKPNLEYKKYPVNSNYLVFNHGEVFSQYICNFMKKMNTEDKQYYVVEFIVGNKYVPYRVNRLVAELFIENPYPDKYDQVDHINRNIKDNRVENLRWVDCKLNSTNKDLSKLYRRPVLQISLETREIVKRFQSVQDAKEARIGNNNQIEGEFKSKLDNKMYLWSYETEELKIKTIPEGFYQLNKFPEYYLSKDGQFYSTKVSKMMKPQITHAGYLSITLRRYPYYVHRIVLEQFMVDKPENYDKYFINHINGDKQDNRVENLEYVTHTQNVRHSIDVLGKGVKRLKCHDHLTGEVLKFKSVAHTVSHFKMTHDTIKKYMKDTCGDKLFRGRYQFELDTDPFVINTDSYNIEAK